MHLLVPNLPYPIPVDDDQVASRRDPTINVRIPTNDPRALALVPGMLVTLVSDDDDERLIVLGRGWTTHNKGSVMRIPYSQPVPEPVAG